MNDKEGVIKYQLNHSDQPLDCDLRLIQQLNVWRSIMLKLDLIGQNPERYEGLGFGNISHRCGPSNQFLITGTQTGRLNQLDPKYYCQVLAIDLTRNSILSQGQCQPSSEALTHAALYQSQDDCDCIIHIHNPEIWRHSHKLDLPQTSVDIAYGTPEMAVAVAALYQNKVAAPIKVFTMAGHEDGVVAFGKTLEQAGLAIIKAFAQALLLESADEN